MGKYPEIYIYPCFKDYIPLKFLRTQCAITTIGIAIYEYRYNNDVNITEITKLFLIGCKKCCTGKKHMTTKTTLTKS